MSFALQPSDGSARLLGPPPARSSRGGSGASSSSSSGQAVEKVQAAIQAVHRFASDVGKEATLLRSGRDRASSAQHVKQVASVARETIKQARGWLQELPSGQKNATDEQTFLQLKREKLTEHLAVAAAEVEKSWSEFAAADAAWVRSQAALEKNGADAGNEDLESGASTSATSMRQQVQQAELVTQAEVDLHTDLAEEYAREVRVLSQDMHGLQRAMVDLAEQARLQGETLNGIEANMDKACEKTAQALEQVHATEERQRQTLKRTLCLLLVVCTFSAIFVGSVWN